MGPCWVQSPWRHVWNSAGVKPDVCDALQRIAQASDPSARVWRGSELPPTMRGMKVLGTPLGHFEYVATYPDAGLLEAVPSVHDVQCAWFLLFHCTSARANYWLRVVRPSFSCVRNLENSGGQLRGANEEHGHVASHWVASVCRELAWPLIGPVGQMRFP